MISTGSTNNTTKKKANTYWTESTEQAVVDYLFLDSFFLEKKIDKYLEERGALDETIDDGYYAFLSNKLEQSYKESSIEKKERIFKKSIEKPLNKLVENIMFTYKLISFDVDIKTQHRLCITHLYTKFANFDPDNGAKAYSYYGTIAKHYLQNRKKDLDEGKNTNLSWDDYKDEVEQHFPYEIDEDLLKDDFAEFFCFINNSFETEIESKKIKPINDLKKQNEIKEQNDTKTINAILEIFENPEMLEADDYSKTSVRDYIREKTKLQDKEFSASMLRIKSLYELKKREFNKQNKDNIF